MKLKTLKEVLASKEAMDRFDSYCRQDVGLTRTLLVYLVGIASARKLTDYNQAGAVVGLAGSSSILWEMLGDISRFTYDSCDVFLSAVVQKELNALLEGILRFEPGCFVEFTRIGNLPGNVDGSDEVGVFF